MEENRTPLLDKIAAILDMGKEKGIAAVLHPEEEAGREKAAALLAEIAAEMKINLIQAALFAFIFDVSFLNQEDSEDDKTTLLKALKCSKIEYIKYLNEIDGLAKTGYVEKNLSSYDLPRFTVPRNIAFSLQKNEPLSPKSIENLSFREFMSELEDIFHYRYTDEMPYDEMRERLETLVQANETLGLVKRIQSYDFNNQIERNLLLYFCNVTASKCKRRNSTPVVVTIEEIRRHFKDPSCPRLVRYYIHLLQNDEHVLQNLSLIEHYNNDGMAAPDEFVLTRKAKKELLPELKSKRTAGESTLLKAADIKEKEMFYNKKEAEAIEKLTRALSPVQFKTVTEKLTAAGLRSGFACLFSGAPGTGKTETVCQIARRTGRDLLRIDISAIKSCWVGESEKNIKEVFTDYREIAEENENLPILFFNEADAVFGKRLELNDSSRSVDHMENAMQNIILEEIENLNGILIATTNLTKNLDKAFERRFLYKIEFGKPDGEVRKNLWLSMMKDLSEEDARRLAARFEISGGQIENIVRKRQVDLVLEGCEPSYDTLVQYCEDEILDKNAGRRLGFAA